MAWVDGRVDGKPLRNNVMKWGVERFI